MSAAKSDGDAAGARVPADEGESATAPHGDAASTPVPADEGESATASHGDAAGARVSAGSVRRFLGEADATTLTAIVDRMFPADDELPAASALGVVDYVDGQLAGPWGAGDDLYRDGPFPVPADSGHGWQWSVGPREAYVAGLDALRRVAADRHGRPFEQLDPDQQDELLRATEAGELDPFGELPCDVFFGLIHANVVEGLFSDPVHGGNRGKAAWKWIGYPG